MHSYADLTALRAAQQVQDTDATDDAKLASLGRLASSRIDAYTSRFYVPEIATRYYTPAEPDVSPNGVYLELTDPLLAISALTVNEGTSVASDQYRLSPRGQYPAYRVERLNEYTWIERSATNWRDSIAVTGTWGYHRSYGSAWLDSADEVEDNPLSSSATTITVNDADGADANGLSPRFAVGQVIRIEDEFLCITGVNTSTQVLTVIRGYRGSTAAAHVQNTQIDVWQVEPDIVRACSLLAAYAYSRRGKFNQVLFAETSGELNTFPPDMPPEVQNILDLYRLKRIYTI